MAKQSETLSSEEFVRKLKDEIGRSPKLRVNHPFVLSVPAGKASKEPLRACAPQDYQFRRLVPRRSPLRYLPCPDPEYQPRLPGVFQRLYEHMRGRHLPSEASCRGSFRPIRRF